MHKNDLKWTGPNTPKLEVLERRRRGLIKQRRNEMDKAESCEKPPSHKGNDFRTSIHRLRLFRYRPRRLRRILSRRYLQIAEGQSLSIAPNRNVLLSGGEPLPAKD